jgi:outer membrane protein assembly factor BamB
MLLPLFDGSMTSPVRGARASAGRWAGLAAMLAAVGCSGEARNDPSGGGGEGGGGGSSCAELTCESLLGPDAQGDIRCEHGSVDTSGCHSKGCGDMSGAERGAGWPMFGACPTHVRRSVHHGPDDPRMGVRAHRERASSLIATSDHIIAVGPRVHGLDRSTLEVVWDPIMPGEVTSVPAVDASARVYASWWDGGWHANPYESGVVAIDHGAHVLWTARDTDPQSWFESPVIAGDGTVVVSSQRGVMAFRPGSDGEVLWVAEPASGGRAPAIGHDGVIYTANDGLYALDPRDGSTRWRHMLPEGARASTSPVVTSGGLVCFGWGDREGPAGHLTCVREDGTPAWTVTADRVFLDPAVGVDGTLYAPARDELQAIDPSGRVRWVFTGDGNLTSPAVDGAGVVYTMGSSGLVYAITPDGELKWQRGTGAFVPFFFHGPVIGHDGTLFVSNADGVHTIVAR